MSEKFNPKIANVGKDKFCFTFGKHRGQRIDMINDVEYLRWCIKDVEGITPIHKQIILQRIAELEKQRPKEDIKIKVNNMELSKLQNSYKKLMKWK